VVTDSDLIGLERRTPFVLRSEIERAPDRSKAVAAFAQLHNVVADLVEARVDPIDIGHVVGVTVDALTERLLELAEAELGPAPCAWAWMALGSQARHEQALATDQDHALVYLQGEPVDEVDRYFAGLAERVESDLERAGIPRCRARVSATQPAWRGTLEQWAERFRGWMQELDEGGAVLTAIGFDFRRVAGALPVDERLQEVVAEAPLHPVFLCNLARQAVALEPPTGFIRDIVVEARGEHAGTFDVKHGGILAITSLARVAALAAGSTERRTLPRLRAAAAHGRLLFDDEEALDESFRLLWDIRLEHQCVRMGAGLVPDDHVDPKELGTLTRQALKEAFRAIERAQRALAVEFGISSS
jgi:CBS domain-containing protein